MYENGYYPMGAENDPNAPWNERHNERKEFDVCVHQTLSKSDSVLSEDYIETAEKDEDGYFASDIDTSNIDFQDCWLSQNYGIDQLLKELERYVTKEFESITEDNRENRQRRRHLKDVLRSCQGWEVVETYVEER